MQFNSYIFIMAFLPTILTAYFLANRIHIIAGKVVLFLGSLFFYGWADKTMLSFLILSIIVNYTFVILIKRIKWANIRILLVIPLMINVGLLLYFKYTNFFIANINTLGKLEYPEWNIVLPIGISFITFQQIAYLVSVYQKKISATDLIDYLTYITYFPKLLMGPLTDPTDFIFQLNSQNRKKVNCAHIAEGLKMFSFGLFKKMVLADTFANAVLWGYTNIDVTTSLDWVLIMLFYTFEIYFDFSGYSDMAVGVSRMLSIDLPMNFDSPYKAYSIRDFWRRWHVSLTKFLTNYIYIPMGGNRKGKFLTYLNTMIVFSISGAWHGANWTFILWGIMHGTLSIFDRIFYKIEEKVFQPVRWFLTFSCVNVLWLLFRSNSVGQWKFILKKMIFIENTDVSDGLVNTFNLPESVFISDMLHLDRLSENVWGFWMLLFLFAAFTICLVPENNYRKLNKTTFGAMILAAIAMGWGVLCLGTESQFVYFGF